MASINKSVDYNIITSSTGTKWEYVIGLEVHAQISSKSKLFSDASTKYGAEPNTQVALFDAAFPGMLPTLNGYCIEQAIKTGIALNGTINTYSVFDRKNYFYPDLPCGYQISQYYYPIVQNCSVEIITEDGSTKIIPINRLHLEQDAGKSLHGYAHNHTLIDLNRAGIALMEIVTDPLITSPLEACEYLKKLRSILRCIGSCDGDMEKGSMRCDANISVRKPGEPLGIRCEIKNLNSTKNLIKAIEFEALRQISIIEQGGVVLQETRLYDSDIGETRSMRLKSDEVDYRYFPDPDLLPISFSKDLIENIAKTLPELPDAKIKRYQEELNINKYDAGIIVADEKTAKYFEEASKTSSPKMVANWMISELFGLLNKNFLSLDDSKITPLQLAELINLIENQTISGKIAKEVFQVMFEIGEDPKKIIEQRGLSQVSNVVELEQVIVEVLKENNNSLIEYKNGKEKLFGFFIGQIMKKTYGKANPSLVNKLLQKKLDDSKI